VGLPIFSGPLPKLPTAYTKETPTKLIKKDFKTVQQNGLKIIPHDVEDYNTIVGIKLWTC